MPVSVVVQGDISRKFSNLKQGIEKIAPGIALKAQQVLQRNVIAEIANSNAIASGDLLKSITSSVIFSNTEYLVEIGSDNVAAPFIERGRKPGGFPPPARILAWMISKGLEPSVSGAFLIAKKIAEKGYDPRQPFEKALETSLAEIKNVIGPIVEKELNTN
jgi:hypothetical protein